MSEMFRVTQSTMVQHLVDDLNSGLRNIQTTEGEAATGKAISQPSDNPGGTAEALGLNAQIAQQNNFLSNVQDAQNWIGAADGALGSSVTTLQRVQTDLENAANASAGDSVSRGALAEDVTAMKQTLLASANTEYGGKGVFSGTWGGQPYPSASTGDYTYAGSTTAQQRTVAQGVTSPIGVLGKDVFGSGSSSVFALLDKISSDITAGNSSTLSGSDMQQLHSWMDTVSQAQGQVGSLGAQMASAALTASGRVNTFQSNLSAIVDADEASVATTLNMQEAAYQAALSVTAKVLQPSLVNYIG